MLRGILPWSLRAPPEAWPGAAPSAPGACPVWGHTPGRKATFRHKKGKVALCDTGTATVSCHGEKGTAEVS